MINDTSTKLLDSTNKEADISFKSIKIEKENFLSIILFTWVFTLLKNNINVHFNITTSGSLLIAERNRILMMFME